MVNSQAAGTTLTTYTVAQMAGRVLLSPTNGHQAPPLPVTVQIILHGVLRKLVSQNPNDVHEADSFFLVSYAGYPVYNSY